MVDRSRGRSWMRVVGGFALSGALISPSLARAQAPTAVDVQAQAQAPPGAAPAAESQAQAPPTPPVSPTEGPAAAPAVGEEKGPNTGRVSVLLGVDWASAYYFRGIVTTQNGGNNAQPYGEIGIRLLENLGPLTSLTFAPGVWNNLHWGGGTVVEPSDPVFYTEVDCT
jgi:hypothetical protein